MSIRDFLVGIPSMIGAIPPVNSGYLFVLVLLLAPFAVGFCVSRLVSYLWVGDTPKRGRILSPTLVSVFVGALSFTVATFLSLFLTRDISISAIYHEAALTAAISLPLLLVMAITLCAVALLRCIARGSNAQSYTKYAVYVGAAFALVIEFFYLLSLLTSLGSS
jgi:hypothetical protein